MRHQNSCEDIQRDEYAQEDKDKAKLARADSSPEKVRNKKAPGRRTKEATASDSSEVDTEVDQDWTDHTTMSAEDQSEDEVMAAIMDKDSEQYDVMLR